MKILIIFAGSQSHFYGIKQWLDHLALDDEVIYASHIGMSEKLQKIIRYEAIESAPAFLDYEFLHYKDVKKIVELKSDMVYYLRRKESLKELIDSNSPEVILVDNHAFTDALIIAEVSRNSAIKQIFYQTRLSTNLGESGKYGGFKGGNFKLLGVSVIKRRKQMRTLRKRLTMPGLNEYHRIKVLIDSLEFQHVGWNRNRAGLDSLTYVPELIFSGTDLSYHVASNQFYSGLCLPERYEVPDKEHRSTILLSAGSRSYTYNEFNRYVETIHYLVSVLSNLYFVLPDTFRARIYGDHVSYYTWDSYHDYLARADVHITHGGINSIRDSLSYGVPMLICPMDWISDQIHNALFFEKLGLSMTWNIKLDRPENIPLKIEELLKDDYHKRIIEYVVRDRQRYPVERIREEFMEMVNDERWEIRNW